MTEGTDDHQASATLSRKPNLPRRCRLGSGRSYGCVSGRQGSGWEASPEKRRILNLRTEGRSLFARGGCRGGPEPLGCAEAPRPHCSSSRPGVSEDTQEETGERGAGGGIPGTRKVLVPSHESPGRCCITACAGIWGRSEEAMLL